MGIGRVDAIVVCNTSFRRYLRFMRILGPSTAIWRVLVLSYACCIVLARVVLVVVMTASAKVHITWAHAIGVGCRL